jgi:hypothetical protein
MTRQKRRRGPIGPPLLNIVLPYHVWAGDLRLLTNSGRERLPACIKTPEARRCSRLVAKYIAAMAAWTQRREIAIENGQAVGALSL